MFSATDSHSETVIRLTRELTDNEALPMGVHTLSEFIYCPRAGAISAESGQEDTGSEMARAPALGGLPWHDQDKIEKAIEQLLHEIKIPVALNVGLYLFAYWLASAWTPVALLALVPTCYAWGQWLLRLLRKFLKLKKRLRIAKQAAIEEPDWELPQAQPIHWWSLIRSGFVSVEKREPLRADAIGLAGKPWRVLHKGNAEYPVIRIRVDDEKHDRRREGRLRKQQMARIAAYAYLLHHCERADSSWAIVLFNHSDEGVAIPITSEAWQAFYGGLIQARGQLQSLRENPLSTPPKNADACIACPLGRPRPIGREKTYRNGKVIASFGTECRSEFGKKKFVVHSTCGDYYQWIPPHENAIKRGLGR